MSVCQKARPESVNMRWPWSGTTRAMLHNLITGVTTGFEKRLAVHGVGYRAQVQGRKLNLNLGFFTSCYL